MAIITATISDHVPQFLISPNTFGDPTSNKSNVFERDWSHFDREKFVLDYFDIDWLSILKLDWKNVYSAISLVLETLLNKYAPLKKVNKYKLRFKKDLGLLPVFKDQYILKTNY